MTRTETYHIPTFQLSILDVSVSLQVNHHVHAFQIWGHDVRSIDHHLLGAGVVTYMENIMFKNG